MSENYYIRKLTSAAGYSEQETEADRLLLMPYGAASQNRQQLYTTNRSLQRNLERLSVSVTLIRRDISSSLKDSSIVLSESDTCRNIIEILTKYVAGIYGKNFTNTDILHLYDIAVKDGNQAYPVNQDRVLTFVERRAFLASLYFNEKWDFGKFTPQDLGVYFCMAVYWLCPNATTSKLPDILDRLTEKWQITKYPVDYATAKEDPTVWAAPSKLWIKSDSILPSEEEQAIACYETLLKSTAATKTREILVLN